MNISFTKTDGQRFEVFEARGNRGDYQCYDIRTEKRLWTHVFVKGSVHNDRTTGAISMKAGTWSGDHPKHLLGIRTFTCEEDNTLFYCIHQKDKEADYVFEKRDLEAGDRYKMTGKSDAFIATGTVDIEGQTYSAPMLIERAVVFRALTPVIFLAIA